MASCRSTSTPLRIHLNGVSNIVQTMLPKRLKRVLLLNCNPQPCPMVVGGSSLEHYAILVDDGYDDDFFPETKVSVVSRDGAVDPKGHYFVPHWSNSTHDESTETVDCDSSDDDDDTQTTSNGVSDVTGAFPKMESGILLFEPPSLDDENVYITTVKGVDPRSEEILSSKRNVHGLDSNALFGPEVDSETEEETSSSSGSSTADDFVETKELLSFEGGERRRSIRFLDEVEGRQLTTVHLVPWTEHDDANWIPRPVRCRIEL
jgi:hypothetical protein